MQESLVKFQWKLQEFLCWPILAVSNVPWPCVSWDPMGNLGRTPCYMSIWSASLNFPSHSIFSLLLLFMSFFLLVLRRDPPLLSLSLTSLHCAADVTTSTGILPCYCCVFLWSLSLSPLASFFGWTIAQISHHLLESGNKCTKTQTPRLSSDTDSSLVYYNHFPPQ